MKLSHFLIATMALSLAACGQQSLPETTVKDAGLGDAFYSSFEAGQPSIYNSDELSYEQILGGLLGVSIKYPWYDQKYLKPKQGEFSDPTALTGKNILIMSGSSTIASGEAHIFTTLFDVNIPVLSGTFLEYWIYPKSGIREGMAYYGYKNGNSSCMGIDLLFTDGTHGRDLGAKDQNGNYNDPAAQCGKLQMNTWNRVKVNFGSVAAGKTIDRIFVGYRSYNQDGYYQSTFDDIRIGTDDTPRVFEAESSGWHGIGHAESDGWSANPSTDGTGHLIYGPYVSDLRPGPHTANFTMLVGNNAGANSNVATIGVWNVTKQRMEGSRTVTRNEWNAASIYQDFQFDFQNSSPGDQLSFLLYWYGGVTYLKLDKITVY
jgi:hypothetical protein